MTGNQQEVPFERFAHFDRVPEASSLFYCEPPEWAAAAHAIVAGETLHHLWGRRKPNNSWSLTHSFAPANRPRSNA